MRVLGILGASGHGKVVAEIARASGWNQIEFYDDAWPGKGSTFSIVGNTATLLASSHRFDTVAVAIGSNAIRWQKIQELQAAGLALATIMHPTATVSVSACLGRRSSCHGRCRDQCRCTDRTGRYSQYKLQRRPRLCPWRCCAHQPRRAPGRRRACWRLLMDRDRRFGATGCAHRSRGDCGRRCRCCIRRCRWPDSRWCAGQTPACRRRLNGSASRVLPTYNALFLNRWIPLC